MIIPTNAIEIAKKNLSRTNALLDAMETIKAYNRLYQSSKTVTDFGPENSNAVAMIQNDKFARIELSCAEHAIISLATAFETYLKELIQELLACYPNHFLSQDDKEKQIKIVRQMIESSDFFTYEEIQISLKLKSRFDYYKFFEQFSIPFLTDKEKELIDYVYVLRNNFVHNAGKQDSQTRTKIKEISQPIKGEGLRTDAKRLRTKFDKFINTLDERVKESFSK